MNTEIINFDHVTVNHGDVVAVRDFSAQVQCSSLVAIVGPNGAGKSTLLRATLGWLPLKTGEIWLGDDHIEHQRPRVAYVPQRVKIDWDFPTTVKSVVEQGRFPFLGRWKGFGKDDRERVDRAIAEMGLDDVRNRQIGELSGGQQQKMFLARALAQGADIFLLDEPFEGLDATATEGLIQTLRNWRDQHRTVLVVIHDLELARRCCTHALLMNTSLVAGGRMADVLTPANIALAYARPPARAAGETDNE